VSDQFLRFYIPGESVRLSELRESILEINLAHKNFHVVRSVLLVGERGTGKSQLAEVIAAHLHWLREFPDGSRETEWKGWTLKKLGAFAGMRRQTLTALPDELAESALFGHKKGAFTGADRDQDGAFNSSSDVDLLLDEIGDASPTIQGKLLEVLEIGRFRPLGAKWTDNHLETQVRVLTATNRNLVVDVENRLFRADLLDRLTTFVIALPPLRESPEQIPVVLERILAHWSRRFGMNELPTVTPADQEFIYTSYTWPGNIRELEHAITAWVLCGLRRSISQIVLTNAELLQHGTIPDVPHAAEGIRRIIRDHMQLVEQGAAPRFESFGSFRDRFGDSGVEVLDEVNSVGSLDLARMFSKPVASVQSQLSLWRKKRGRTRASKRIR
jgi:transcriptional regulator with GAF, ATPase, and Fis domain